MSRLRLPLLAVMLLIVGVVGRSWWNRYKHSREVDTHRPAPPPAHTTLISQNWSYTQSEKGRIIVEVQARSFRQPENSNAVELEGVELKIYNKDSTQYDKVRSEKALFTTSDGVLVSDGDVEITIGVPEKGPPKEKLLKIKSSGVRYESKTGKATTEKEASFTFDRGEGKSVGASYDPGAHELVMKSQVELHWKGKGNSKDMTVQAGELHYKENESKVYMSPWSKLMRDTLTLNAADSVVTLKEGAIDVVDATKAMGTDNLPDKKVDYAADQLHMQFSDEGEVKSIEGTNNAKVVSVAKNNQTTITADKVNMDFATAGGGSTLQKAVANGKAVVEAKPMPQAGVQPADTRILRSDIVEMTMRAGGQEIDKVVTPTPGSVEFLPNRPASRKRQMQGERLDIQYGADNQIQTFKSVNVSTRTENEQKKGQKTAPPPSLTWSKELLATFDPKTGDLTKLEQWKEFRYEEGDRKATADKAVLEQAVNLITLDGKAKVWDSTGSNAADHIVMDQKNDATRAEGNVVSLRLPETDPKKNDASLLAPDEPLQAKAKKMISADGNAKIHYEGDALLWQGVNRLQADKIDIDRDDGTVKANGKVVSQFVEKPKPDDPKSKQKKDTAPVYTVIRAPEMFYNDDERMAHYKGGVLLTRPGLDVKSNELRAFLKDEDKSDSSLDHAFADGKVEILQRATDRNRTGLGQHAEYYVDDEKIFLSGGEPQLTDSVRGTTKGKQLTYFANNDRLIVDGEEPKKPAYTQLKRKAKKGPK